MPVKDSVKVSELFQVQELIINKEPQLLDNFTDEVVAFQADRSQDVRKFVVGFMEEACKKDAELFSKLLLNFNIALQDEAVNVIKKVIQASTQLFRCCLEWICSSKKLSEGILQSSWKLHCDIIDKILNLLDSENDGIRTQSVKFAEKVILTLSNSSKSLKDVSNYSFLDVVPTNKIVNKKSLKSLGENSLQLLLKFVASPSISSVNLIASLGTLSNIARHRPQFISTVVESFETLHANLPPTLAKTQVTSVRKHLKMQLLNLLKLPFSIEFHPQIMNLLYDLGTTSQEISRNVAKVSSQMKKASKRPIEENKESKIKKTKIEIKDEYEEEEEESKAKDQNSAIDVTADELVPLLTPENVANLVLLSMVMLPDKIPDAFQASYTPIESAGTMEQMMHLARLLSIQMTAVGIGSGIEYAAQIQAEEDIKKKLDEERNTLEQEKNKPSVAIQTLIGGTTLKKELKKEEKVKMVVTPTVPVKSLQRRIQGFHLASLTKPLDLEVKDRIIKQAVLRVLKAEKNAISGKVHYRWQKILTSLVAQFGGDLHRSLAQFIMFDIKNRSELAFQWIYEEFNIYLENSHGINDKIAMENYDACLTGLLQGLLDKHDAKEGLFSRLVVQAPLLTDRAIQLVKKYCQDERHSHTGLLLVRNMLKTRPIFRMQFLRALLDLTVFTSEKAIEIAKNVYDNNINLKEFVEQFAIVHLQYLVLEYPPKELNNVKVITEDNTEKEKWTEVTIKRCFMLFLSLLPFNHSLIHKLAEIYVKSVADIKRVILRSLEAPVVAMGMASIEVLRLVENCPQGAETLVTRMLHILTDKEHPSAELVAKVRDLYHKRVPDVRFLIPVLNGLNKEEVVVALPKLIRLNPPVVKGVFNRLFGVQKTALNETSSLTPAELLVALHNINDSKADVKCVIKATSLCFAEKSVYTSEVLVTVINHLMEQEVMPTLLMRTVIQSLISYPRLSGFVMNVLQRLILKRVWEQTQVWEGFIKCCQRVKPQSFQVLLQLPPEQLVNVFKTLPEIKEPLLQHVNKFTPQQRQHVSPAILSVLESRQTNQFQKNTEDKRAELLKMEKLKKQEEQKKREIVKNYQTSSSEGETKESEPFPSIISAGLATTMEKGFSNSASFMTLPTDIKPEVSSVMLESSKGLHQLEFSNQIILPQVVRPDMQNSSSLAASISLPANVLLGLPLSNIQIPPPGIIFPSDSKRLQRSPTPTMDE